MPEPTNTATDRSELLPYLMEVSETVAAHQVDLDRLLEKLSVLVRRVVDYEVFAVLLAIEEHEVLEIRHAVGLPESVLQNVKVPLQQGITGTAAAEGRAIVVNDVSSDTRYIQVRENVRSEMAVPLIARGKTIGVLDLQSTRLNAFRDDEQRMLSLIASRVSLAVDNARLFAQTARQNSELKTLLELSQEFSTILDLDQLLETVALVTRRLIDYDAYSIFLLGAGERELRHYRSYRHDRRRGLESVPLDTGVVGAAARTGKPVLVLDTLRDPNFSATIEGVRSEVAVPLKLQDQVIGVLTLESNRPNFFRQHHVNSLLMLGSQLAAAIENARLFERVSQNESQLKTDLAAARRLQRELLLPPYPTFEGVDIAAQNEPLREVSGDFYDFYAYPGRHIGMLLGDVSGKGAAAALYGALVSGLLRSLVRLEQSPAALLAEVNRALTERQDSPATFAATAYAQWDPKAKRLTLSNSGLPFPFVRKRGKVQVQELPGVPLGMFRKNEYEELSVELGCDDLVVLVSDGVVESQPASGEEYGSERLTGIVEASIGCSAQEVLERILADLKRHMAGATIRDDQTLIVMRVL